MSRTLTAPSGQYPLGSGFFTLCKAYLVASNISGKVLLKTVNFQSVKLSGVKDLSRKVLPACIVRRIHKTKPAHVYGQFSKYFHFA